ncbi:MAG TPA: TIGR03013 family PEP-CTERM/XrtA system glycosyltransferase [Steroidobacteraceae bacterium]|nr:TIGR03013 family PEP-CTERM/XrtA system glycosyltransferase [Steroidobacteraceae bacterium]
MKLRLFRHYVHLPTALLAIVELLVLVSAPIIVDGLRERVPRLPMILVFSVSCFVALLAMGLYSVRQRARLKGVVLRAGLAHLLAMAMVVIVTFFFEPWRPSPRQLLEWAALSLFLIAIVRLIGDRMVDEDAFKRVVLVYGAGQRALSLSQLRRRSDQRGFRVAGYIAAPGETTLVTRDLMTPGPRERLQDLAGNLHVDEIVVAMDDRRREFPVRELLDCRLAGIEVIDIVSFLERETGRVRLDVLNPSWIIFGEGFRRDPVRQFTKRSFDVIAALALLLVTLPFIMLTMFAIALEDGPRGPYFYRQRRVGLDGKVFNVLKFRSMTVDAESDGRPRWATSGDARVTRVGRLIRKVRIDELPQVFNVLRGDMSFVGPRPERPEFVSQFGESVPYYDERHCAKPGITGWAQLCYPYGASEKDAIEKLQYDLYYVKNHTLLFDLMILLQTVEVVVFGKGGR